MKVASDTGKLFGSVTANDVVVAIKKAGGPSIDKRSVRLPKGPYQGDRQPHRGGAPAPRGGRRRHPGHRRQA